VTVAARLIASIALPSVEDDHLVHTQWWPDRVVWFARTDTQIIAYDLDRLPGGDVTASVFPAPWPRKVGRCTVSPDLSFAVFSGVHAVQAFDAGGGMRWQVRHSCWSGSCLEQHTAYQEYADDGHHRYPENGSARVSTGGKLVWAHVRGPLPGDEVRADRDSWLKGEQWLALDPASGRLLGRISTETYAGGSHQLPHPDPERMALNVGEGQDGSTTWVGRFVDGRLEGVLIGKEAILIGVASSGRTLVTVDHGSRDELNLHRYEDGAVIATFAAGWLSKRDDRATLLWDLHEIGAVDEHTVILSTSVEGDREKGVEHWLIDTDTAEVSGPVIYPGATPKLALGFGSGRWLTATQKARYEVWSADKPLPVR
jgi:hypothetical protein